MYLARILHKFLEPGLLGDSLQIAVVRNLVRIAEAEIDGDLKFVKALFRLSLIREGTGEVVVPSGIIRQKLNAFAARLYHRLRVALAKRDYELLPQLVVTNLTGRIVPNRQDGQKDASECRHEPIFIQRGSLTSLASRLWLVESDCTVPIEGDSS